MFRFYDLHHFTKLAFLALCCLFLGSNPIRAQVGMGLAPLRVEIKAQANTPYSNSLMISNETSDSLRVRADNLDFTIDDDEQPQFQPMIVEQAPHSCRSWVKVNPAEFQLAAGEHKMIRYSFQFPAEMAEASYECALGFTTMPAHTSEGTGVVTNVRLVTAFYVTNGKPVPNGVVKSMQIVPAKSPEEKRRALLFMANNGSTYFRVIGSLDVIDEAEKTIESVPFRAIPVLPGKVQRFSFGLKSDYVPAQKLRARFDIGSGETQEVIAPISPTSAQVGSR